ncbi:uncharacterized protein MAM_04645 [Metarhizium album ARSEF 1941]|uniref:Methyltransferase domain-containing protein n=1 Tax=Metarhizium album (strain ARSEF 1941) TaxID=1081103 RepID=A0A0B2WXN7_METAS|nr:uncharacterized protein MAM_04645 [Metarhizium album ARSEF 1941]KHN97630.1 hypothetical protein MAM_04645 [Metarhizium album ARSEF 1941]
MPASLSASSANEKTAELYKTRRLLVYDYWVLGIVSTYAWGCPTSQYPLPQFRANVGKNHLDIGIGTGYYLRKGRLPATTRVTLVDIEKTALEFGLKRCGRSDARGIVADILKPLPVDDKFDSVSMYYLLHCIPATVEDKCGIFSHIRNNMTSDGVIHGATVVARGVRKDGRFAAHMRRKVVEAGIFQNADDNPYDFEHALRRNFHQVEVRVVGAVFLFRAAKPKSDNAE